MRAIGALLLACCSMAALARAAEPPAAPEADVKQLAQALASADRGTVEAAAQSAGSLAAKSGCAAIQPLTKPILAACARYPDIESLWKLVPALQCPREQQMPQELGASIQAEVKRAKGRAGALLALAGTLEGDSQPFWPLLEWALQQPSQSGLREPALASLARIGKPAAESFGKRVADLAANDRKLGLTAEIVLVRMGLKPTRSLAEAIKLEWSAQAHSCLGCMVLEEPGRELLQSSDSQVRDIYWYWVIKLIESAQQGLPNAQQPVIRDPRAYLAGKVADVRALAEQARKASGSGAAAGRIAEALKKLESFEKQLKGEAPAGPEAPAKPPPPAAPKDKGKDKEGDPDVDF